MALVNEFRDLGRFMVTWAIPVAGSRVTMIRFSEVGFSIFAGIWCKERKMRVCVYVDGGRGWLLSWWL